VILRGTRINKRLVNDEYGRASRTDRTESEGDTADWADVSRKSDLPRESLDDPGTGDAGNDRPDPPAEDGRTPADAESPRDAAETSRSDEAEALVRSILDGLQEPVVVDADGRITHVNKQALELYDCTEARAVGASPHALQDGDSPASDVVDTALRRREDVQQREETMLVDGEETPLEWTVTVLYGDDGALTGAMLVEKDVTERNRQREKKRYLERYQGAVLDDLQDKLVRFSEGDLTIDPTVPRPEREYDEVVEIYDEFALLNEHLNTAVDNIREVVDTLTENADTLSGAGESLIRIIVTVYR
jgi:PAS domain S-box-containing protein